MLKNVLPKILFVAAIVAIIAAGNYFFDEQPHAAVVKTKPAVEEPAADEPAADEPAADEPADAPAEEVDLAEENYE